MNNEKLKQILDSFFTNETQNMLIIKGGWGIGKTYFWNNYFESIRGSKKHFKTLNAYSYVSLFGINDISALQNKIITNTEIIDESGYKKLVKKQNKNINKFIKGFFNVPIIKKGIYDVTPFLHNMIQNQLICFDDLERCSDKFSIGELMGYADELVQQKNCKMIIIFNEGQLNEDEKKLFNQYREKIIDIEVTYSPTLESNFNMVFLESNIGKNWQKKVRERCMLLGINNIRVLKKIRYGLEEYWSYIQENEFPDKVRDSFIQNFVSFYSLYLEEKEDHYQDIKNKIFSGRLRVSDVVSMSYGSYWLNEKKDPSLDLELVRKYLLESSSIFDDDIVFYINNGYISSDFIAKSKSWFEDLQHEAKVLECKNKVSKIWDLYHSTLLDNLDDIIKTLNDLIKDDDIFDYLDVQNFFQFIKSFYFFQELEDSKYEVREIYPYIDKYVNKNKPIFLESDKGSILASIEFTSFGTQKTYEHAIDDYTKEKINELRSAQYQKMEIWDLLKKIYEAEYSSPEEKLLLEGITKDQYIELFEQHKYPELTQIVRQAYRELSPDKRGEFEAALDEVSKKSALNAHRVAVLKKIH